MHAARLSGLLVILLFFAAQDSWAQQESPAVVQESRAMVGKGNRLFELGRFADALKLYEKAYEMRGVPSTLFNIAQCHRQLNDYKKALFFYRNYLARAPSAPNRTDVEAIITELEALQKKQEEAKSKPPVSPDAQPSVLPRSDAASSSTSLSAGRETSSNPWYKRWYVWTGIGAVIVGGVVTGVVLSSGGGSTNVPKTPNGNFAFMSR
jgi:tetratricopeptide (TPR) repeat protein